MRNQSSRITGKSNRLSKLNLVPLLSLWFLVFLSCGQAIFPIALKKYLIKKRKIFPESVGLRENGTRESCRRATQTENLGKCMLPAHFQERCAGQLQTSEEPKL